MFKAKFNIVCILYYAVPRTSRSSKLEGLPDLWRLTQSAKGEHTKDAVYIDAERRFQELEKACIAHETICKREAYRC